MGLLSRVDCKIILNNNTTYAGGMISGHVVYHFDSPEAIGEIKLCVRGKGQIKYQRGKTMYYHKEKFLKDDVVICAEAGTYTFPFSYIVPLMSPSTFTYYDRERSVTSYIKYYIKTKRSTTLWTHKDAEEQFFVLKYMDLNLVTDAKEAAAVNVNKDTFWLCCSSRPFFVSFSLAKQGHVPGAEIPFILDCNNQSTYKANDIVVSLQLTITYYRVGTDGERFKLDIKPSIIELSECSLGPVNVREAKTWNQTLGVPEIQPVHSYGCKIIEFNYVVRFKVKFGFPHRNLKGHVPVILGNVPITDGKLPDYAAAMQAPTTNQLSITAVRNLKDIKKYKLKKDANNI